MARVRAAQRTTSSPCPCPQAHPLLRQDRNPFWRECYIQRWFGRVSQCDFATANMGVPCERLRAPQRRAIHANWEWLFPLLRGQIGACVALPLTTSQDRVRTLTGGLFLASVDVTIGLSSAQLVPAEASATHGLPCATFPQVSSLPRNRGHISNSGRAGRAESLKTKGQGRQGAGAYEVHLPSKQNRATRSTELTT